MTNDEAVEQIEMNLADSERSIQKAMAIADQYGLIFQHLPQHIGTYHGKGYDGEDGWLSVESVVEEGAWHPSAWNSSSLYC